MYTCNLQPIHFFLLNFNQLQHLMFPGYRLKNIRLGVTDIDPLVSAPKIDTITVCACQNNPLADGETKSFPCWATGRYLVVILQGTNSLALCEVEVFEGEKPIKIYLNHLFILWTESQLNIMQRSCVFMCLERGWGRVCGGVRGWVGSMMENIAKDSYEWSFLGVEPETPQFQWLSLCTKPLTR